MMCFESGFVGLREYLMILYLYREVNFLRVFEYGFEKFVSGYSAIR